MTSKMAMAHQIPSGYTKKDKNKKEINLKKASNEQKFEHEFANLSNTDCPDYNAQSAHNVFVFGSSRHI